MTRDNLHRLLEMHQIKIYFIAIVIGAIFGLSIAGIRYLEHAINPALMLMLFATFLQVPIVEIGSAFKKVRFISALFITNFMIIPIVLFLFIPFLPEDSLIRIAILFVLLSPCVDYVITFTQLGKGDAKLLLAITPVTLLIQMILTPIYLSLFLGSDITHFVQIAPFLHAFIAFIILPMVLAALVQYFTKRNLFKGSVIDTLNLLPVPVTALVLLIVPASLMPHIGLAQSAALQALPFYIIFAIIAPFLGKPIALLFKLETQAARSISFSASYRNSLIILPLALTIPGSMPIIPAVILTQTIVELCFLPIYVNLIPKQIFKD